VATFGVRAPLVLLLDLASNLSVPGSAWVERAIVPRSVLVVDDHEAIRRAVRAIFQMAPEFTVCGEAANGADAVAKAQQLCPDLIVLDLSMPEMNGIEAATALKYMMPDVPLFLLTAHYSREVELAAREAGICAVFSKYEGLGALVVRARSEFGLHTPVGNEPSSQRGSRP
jgi:DNA-binding NarL/FixJ family response regulator